MQPSAPAGYVSPLRSRHGAQPNAPNVTTEAAEASLLPAETRPISPKRRFLIINSDIGRVKEPAPVLEDTESVHTECDDEGEVDAARKLMSEQREVQVAWLALVRAMKKTKMRARDIYDSFDTDHSDSLNYHEFSTGVQSFNPLQNELVGTEPVISLVQSLFPDRNSEVSFDVFQRVLQMYQAKCYPHGTFAEWAGKQLLQERKEMARLKDKIAVMEDRVRVLGSMVDDLRLIEVEGQECASALAASRAQVHTLVAIRDELVRANRVLMDGKRDAEARATAFESLGEQQADAFRVTHSELKGTGKSLTEALEL